MLHFMETVCENPPIFNFKERNRPAVCGDCGGKMIEVLIAVSDQDQYGKKVLLCTKCHRNFNPSKIKNKKELFDEIDRKSRTCIL